MADVVAGAAGKLKNKQLRVKHQRVKLFRANETVLSVFMWGVNHTVLGLNHVSAPVMLLPDDFKSYSKVKVDNHLYNKQTLPSHFKVKEYCPLVFQNLRERFGIDNQTYRESLTASQPIPLDSPGRSNARFYLSHDHLFVIKTLMSEEVEHMHSFLKHYHGYIVEAHGKTLLPQYMGLYRLTVDGVEHYMVVMRNVFSYNFRIHWKYDLKGSTVERMASDREKEKDLPTLKDNDFVNNGQKIYIGPEAKEKLMETLKADCAFLTKLNVMDYSLLLGIHDCERGEMEEEADARAALEEGQQDEDTGGEDSGGDHPSMVPTPPDSPGHARVRGTSNGQIDPQTDIFAIPSQDTAPRREIYFLAIIDALTHYGVKKQAAKAAKTMKYGDKAEGISTVEPEQYARRFLEFMARAIE
ncbi:unnamed protein product [Cyprideis torosa]|uniref:1-phosphatidylinositol-5-phosphate 4-kinase n=1 Tax=Cyprideis torosa TaxID=163714 RepID=A0A7R8ZTY5_9CRUS|nr:unnamed protein product [Cyprideis torosa]CAG0899210.1 unnamed protein product [Cyprideis torosa]